MHQNFKIKRLLVIGTTRGIGREAVTTLLASGEFAVFPRSWLIDSHFGSSEAPIRE